MQENLQSFTKNACEDRADEVIAHYQKNPPRGEVVIVLDHFIKTTNEEHIQELLKNHEKLKATELTKKIMKETSLSRMKYIRWWWAP